MESDSEFLDRLRPSWPGSHDSVRLPMSDLTRLLAIARRNAAPSSGWEWMREQAADPVFLRPLVEEQSKGEWDDKTIDEDVAMFSAAIRALPPPPAEGKKIVTVYEPFPGAWDDILGPDKFAFPPPPAEGE